MENFILWNLPQKILTATRTLRRNSKSRIFSQIFIMNHNHLNETENNLMEIIYCKFCSTLKFFSAEIKSFLLPGLWRGWHGILVRTAVGSSAQLSTFSKTKDLLMQYEFFADSIFFTALGASMVSGLFTAITMTPFDTVATRMFNQGRLKEFSRLLQIFSLVSIQVSMRKAKVCCTRTSWTASSKRCASKDSGRSTKVSQRTTCDSHLTPS